MKERDELVHALQMRVSKLEAQSRQWRALNVLTVLAGIFVVIVGARRSDTPGPTVIRARTIEAQDVLLNDDQGRLRARLSVDPTQITRDGKVYHIWSEKVIPGQASLQFFDEKGEELWVEPKHPTMEQIR